MIFVPVPFVVALLLSILLGSILRGRDPGAINRPFVALICVCALQSIIVGLRWGYGITELRHALPVLAASAPPLVLASFRGLTQREEGELRPFRWLHALPAVLMVLLQLFAPQWIDVALMVLYVGYALAIINLAWSGPDGLDEARLENAAAAHRALLIAAASLCVSALFDLAMMLDFYWNNGTDAGLMVTNANLLGLFLLGLTASVAARAQPSLPAPAGEHEDLSLAAQDRDVLDRTNRVLTNHKLFRDDNLTLSRLARRVGVPTRQISGAVNRTARKNVSQYINDFRIAEACRLLQQTDMSVTSAMFEAGFQTKSNFNREFRRVTSLNPAAWREQHRRPSPD